MYEQPKLNYELNELEPYLDEENLTIHYHKHHPAYIKKYNDAVQGTTYETVDLKEVLTNLNSITDEKLRNTIRNMGGGAWNHSFFWENMCPAEQSGTPNETLMKAINESFGSFEEFKKQFKETAVSVFGSGWAWLIKNKEGKLEITKTQNQDCPLTNGQQPIMTIDVWEHAYYLKYKNLRPDFIEAFMNVINWKQVEENYNNSF